MIVLTAPAIIIAEGHLLNEIFEERDVDGSDGVIIFADVQIILLFVNGNCEGVIELSICSTSIQVSSFLVACQRRNHFAVHVKYPDSMVMAVTNEENWFTPEFGDAFGLQKLRVGVMIHLIAWMSKFDFRCCLNIPVID